MRPPGCGVSLARKCLLQTCQSVLANCATSLHLGVQRTTVAWHVCWCARAAVLPRHLRGAKPRVGQLNRMSSDTCSPLPTASTPSPSSSPQIADEQFSFFRRLGNNVWQATGPAAQEGLGCLLSGDRKDAVKFQQVGVCLLSQPWRVSCGVLCTPHPGPTRLRSDVADWLSMCSKHKPPFARLCALLPPMSCHSCSSACIARGSQAQWHAAPQPAAFRRRATLLVSCCPCTPPLSKPQVQLAGVPGGVPVMFVLGKDGMLHLVVVTPHKGMALHADLCGAIVGGSAAFLSAVHGTPVLAHQQLKAHMLLRKLFAELEQAEHSIANRWVLGGACRACVGHRVSGAPRRPPAPAC